MFYKAKQNHKIKLTFLTVLLFFIIGNIYAYNDGGKITLHEVKTPLKKVILKIEKQSGLNFLYESELVDLNQLVTIKANNTSLKSVLSKIFNQKKLSYKIIDNQILLKKKKVQHNIAGKIIDKKTKEIIPYASVYMAALNNGTSSNEEGEFEIKIDSLPVEITFSHIGYESKILTINNEDKLIVELVPSTNVLEEVVVKTVGKKKDRYAYGLVKKAYNKISSSSKRKKNSQYARAFYRQKSKNSDTYTEFAEIIYDINYNTTGVVNWDILQGRYAIKEKSVNNKNFTLFSRILKSIQPQTNDIIFPVNEKLDELYTVRVDEMINYGNDKIAIVKFTPLGGIKTPIFEAEAYISTTTYDLLKVKGVINNDNFKFIQFNEKNTFKKNYKLTYEMTFKKGAEKNLLIDYIKVDQEFDYYRDEQLVTKMSATSNLTFFEYYSPNTRKKLGRQFGKRISDWEKLNQVGYSKVFWENNPIVKRTPVEKEVIDAFEKQDAFESIFFNSKDQIVSLQNNLSEDPLIKKIDTLFSSYNYYNPIEKVYVQTDKNTVLPGEELWYTAYTVVGPSHFFSAASKFLHVDIVDKNNKLIVSQKLKIENGKSNGYIRFPKTIAPGKHEFRAYTDWMRNYENDFIFKKTINVTSNNQFVSNTKGDEIDLQFFPEGGNAIAGLNGRIAFKAIGTDGLARRVSGTIVDTKGNEIKGFKTNEKGIGYFNLLPTSGQQYTAVLTDGSRYNLPKVSSEGYTILLNNFNEKSIVAKIQASSSLKGKDFYLIGHVRGVKYYQAKFNFRGKSLVTAEIPKSILESGVFTLTVLDENMVPWAERIAFINNQRDLEINVDVDKRNLSTIGEITVDINVSDANGTPISTYLSTAITNPKNVKKGAYDSNIVTHLLFESDLKGHVENPGQYFKNQSRIMKYNLDLIMMTNGWRRFNWEKLNRRDFDTIKKFSFPDGFNISGIAKGTKNELLSNKSLHMIVESYDEERLYVTKTKRDGSFTFENVAYEGNAKVKFKAYKGKQIDVAIEIDASKNLIELSPVFPNNYIISADKNQVSYVNNENTVNKPNPSDETTLLNEVVLKGKTAEKKYTKSHLGVQPDATLFVDKPYLDFLQMLNTIPGVRVVGQGLNTRVSFVRNAGRSIQGNSNPLFVVDGVALANSADGITVPAQVAYLDVNNVERIEVIKRAEAFYGIRGANGVVLIYTKRGTKPSEGKMLEPKFSYEGFTKYKEFYTPKYQTDLSKVSANAYRKTLFWSPSITTNKNGKARIKFYNVTEADEIQIAIDALTITGVPGSYLNTFKK